MIDNPLPDQVMEEEMSSTTIKKLKKLLEIMQK